MSRLGPKTKKIRLVVEKTTIEIYEWEEDSYNRVKRLIAPLHAAHFTRDMGFSYRWEEDGVAVKLEDLYNQQPQGFDT